LVMANMMVQSTHPGNRFMVIFPFEQGLSVYPDPSAVIPESSAARLLESSRDEQ